MSVVEFSADAWQASSSGLQGGLARRVEVVSELAQGLQALAVSDQISGRGADAMRAYIREVHGPILQSLLIGLSTFQTAVGVYWDGYAQVDAGGDFRLVRDEFEAHLAQLESGMGKLRGFASELRTIAGDASHLVSLGGAGAPAAERCVDDLGRMHAIVKGQKETWEGYEGSDHGFAQVRQLIAELHRIVAEVGAVTVGRGRSYRAGSFSDTFQGLGALTAGMVEYCQANQKVATAGWEDMFSQHLMDVEAAEKARREQAGWDLIWDGLQILAGAVVTVIGVGLTPFTGGFSLGLTAVGATLLIGGINNAINHASIAATGNEFNLAGMAAQWWDTNVAAPVASWGGGWQFAGGVLSGAGHALTGVAQLNVKDATIGVTALITDQAARDVLWNQVTATIGQVAAGNAFVAGQLTAELATALIPGTAALKTTRTASQAGKAAEVTSDLRKTAGSLSTVQALKKELKDAARGKDLPDYDPTGGLGWPQFLEEFLNGIDDSGRPRWNWPSNPPHVNGFTDGKSAPSNLKPGDTFERIAFVDANGDIVDGAFATPLGTPFEKLSLPPDRLGANTVDLKYEVLKPLPDGIRMGDIAPGFGQPGHGVQYLFPDGINRLLREGYLGVVK